MQYEQELEKLNEYQRNAVLDESNACLVNANVGSGKTTVLITKILYLHENKQIPYQDMVVLTFTNKAADEIKERLLERESTLTKEDLPWFGTFHGVCLSLLKQILPVEKLGYSGNFMVMDPEEELQMAEQLILEHQLKIKYKNRLKKRLEQAMAVCEEEKKISRYQDDIFLLTELLRGEKRKQDKMTYLDLLESAIFLLKTPEVCFTPQWIIIDEVQDSDKKQLELLDALKKPATCLFAVGDPNQVIYSWRGSAFNVFYTLRTRYQAKELTLPINYRSSGSILEAARFFLQNGSRLEGVKETGHKIIVKNHYNPFQEADYLASKIRSLQEKGISYGDIAIFYRLQNQSKLLEDVLEREGIPYEVSLKKSIQDIPVLHWLIRVFRFSVNPADITSGVLVLCDRDYGVGMTEKEAMVCIKNGGQTALLEKMSGFPSACRKGLSLDRIIEYFELDSYLRPTSATFLEDKAAVCRFLELLGDYMQKEGLDLEAGLVAYLNHSALYGMSIFEKKIEKENDSVKLMTLHASKGLEFSYVFIIGVNYGLIPLQTKDMEMEEEERRLFFVGLTRAKDDLELSYYTSPDQYRVMPGPSRYLSMIPEKLVYNESAQSGPKMDTAARLQEIKRQILESRSQMQYLFPEQGIEEKTEEKAIPNPSGAETDGTEERRVFHKKYGKGMIVREDADNIVVDFEDYGEKEFLKLFCELEELRYK